MAISSFDRPAGLPPIDFDFLLKAKAYGDEENKKVNQAYDDAYAEFNKVLAMPQEEAKRNQALKPYLDGMNSWANKYADNPRQGLPELRKLVRDFKQDFNYGQLGAIHQAGKSFYETSAQIDKMDQEGKLAGMGNIVKDQLLYKPANDYIKTGGTKEASLGTGIYTKPSFGQPFELKDLGKEIRDLIDTWEKTDEIIDFGAGVTGKLARNNAGYLIRGTETSLDDRLVTDAAIKYLYANPSYARQIDLMSSFNEDKINQNYADIQLDRDPQGRPMKYGIGATPQGLVSTMIPFGSDLTRDQLTEMAKVAALKEKGRKLNIVDLKNWQEEFAMEQAAKAKEKEPTILPPDPVTQALLTMSASPQGTSTANIDVVAPLLGVTAYDPKDNYVNVSLTNRPVLFEFGTTGDSDKDLNNGAYVMAYSRLKDIRKQAEVRGNARYTDAELAAIEPKLLNDPKKPYDPKTNPVIYKSAGEEIGYFGPTGELVFTRKDSPQGPSIRVPKKDFTAKAVKYQSGYQEFVNKFKADYGIDITDPKFEAEVNKILSDPKKRDKQKEKLALGFMEKLSNVKFVPSADATLKTGNNKKPYVSGTAEVTADQFRGMFGDEADDMQDYGLENGVMQIAEKDADGKATKYLIKMNIPVSRTGPDATQTHWVQKSSNEERGYVPYQIDVAQRAAGVMGYAAPAQKQYQRMIELEGKSTEVLNTFYKAIDAGEGTPEQKNQAKQSVQTIISNIGTAEATGNPVSKLQNYGFLGELANVYGLLK